MDAASLGVRPGEVDHGNPENGRRHVGGRPPCAQLAEEGTALVALDDLDECRQVARRRRRLVAVPLEVGAVPVEVPRTARAHETELGERVAHALRGVPPVGALLEDDDALAGNLVAEAKLMDELRPRVAPAEVPDGLLDALELELVERQLASRHDLGASLALPGSATATAPDAACAAVLARDRAARRQFVGSSAESEIMCAATHNRKSP